MTDSLNSQLPEDRPEKTPGETPEKMSQADLNELAAGYVLGDLSSEEAELFHRAMVKTPELAAEVTSLQETLAMMPYALPQQQPNADVRSRTLTAWQAELDMASRTTVPVTPPTAAKTAMEASEPAATLPTALSLTEPRPFRKQLILILGGMAIGGAITLGSSSWKTANRDFSIAVNSNESSDLQIAQTDQTLSDIDQVWSGFRALSQDHYKSLSAADGPVDFTTQQASDILSQTQNLSTTLAALPILPAEKGKLLGSSDCTFGTTAGLRLSYQLKDGSHQTQLVSAYQLDLSGDQFPTFHDSYITLRQPDGTGIVLWREKDYVYALVAELPIADLSAIAQSMAQI